MKNILFKKTSLYTFDVFRSCMETNYFFPKKTFVPPPGGGGGQMIRPQYRAIMQQKGLEAKGPFSCLCL